MKRLFSFLALSLLLIQVYGQGTTATTTAATRLFSDKLDLSSVLSIVPKGSEVTVLDSDSSYCYITVGDYEGYVFKRHISLDAVTSTAPSPVSEQVSQVTNVANVSSASTTTASGRLATLQSRYDAKMAKAIYERKIWKGMNTDMVIDSWGNPKKINREIIPDNVKEEWQYSKCWLYFENDILINWGAIKQ